jgi:hypothetical protein
MNNKEIMRKHGLQMGSQPMNLLCELNDIMEEVRADERAAVTERVEKLPEYLGEDDGGTILVIDKKEVLAILRKMKEGKV